MKSTTKDVQAMRNEFAAIRAKAIAAGMSREEFAREARSCAHESADGEDVRPCDHVTGAHWALEGFLREGK